MKIKFKKSANILMSMLRSPQGKSLGTFAIFLGISAVLWLVLSLNEIAQRDLRCPIRISHVPDSLTRVSPLPEAINVSVKVRTASLLSYLMRGAPTVDIDYRTYVSHNTVQISSSALRNMMRGLIGQNSDIVALSPDSLSVSFTNSPGVLMPVKVESRIETAPQFTLASTPQVKPDSVRVYSLRGIPYGTNSISTSPIITDNLSKNTLIKVPLIAPAGCRVIPDSVDVNIIVDPLVSKTAKVTIRATGAPQSCRLITMPMQIEVNYMLPLNVYKSHPGEPKFEVEARYSELSENTDKIPVHLTYAPPYVSNAFLEVDSVMYLIEQIH